MKEQKPKKATAKEIHREFDAVVKKYGLGELVIYVVRNGDDLVSSCQGRPSEIMMSLTTIAMRVNDDLAKRN